MTAAERVEFSSSLKVSKLHAKALLPKEAGLFFGNRIGIDITGSYLEEHGKPSDASIALLRLILKDLPKILTTAERIFDEQPGDSDQTQQVHKPHIYIFDHRSGEKEAWSLVFTLKDSNLSYHIVFSRLNFVEIWAAS